jgi:hypothetical protein
VSWDKPSPLPPQEIANAAMKIILAWPARSRAARARAERLFEAGQWVESHREIFEKLLHA